MLTLKQKAAQKRYRESPKGRAKIYERNNTPEHKEYIRNYNRKPETKLKQKEYQKTARARELRFQNENSPEGFIRRRKWMLKKYNLSLEDYEALKVKQNNCCAICGAPPGGAWNILAVDHCHTTGRVRGLLCFNCNSGLGNFRDTPDFLLKAVEYLNVL